MSNVSQSRKARDAPDLVISIWERLRTIWRRKFKLKYIYFAWKLLSLKARYGAALILRSFTLSLERGVILWIEDDGALEFGNFVYIKRHSSVEAYGRSRIRLGNRVFVNRNCTIVARSNVSIGDDCLIGENVSIYDHDHEFAIPGIPIQDQGYRTKDVTIGNRVWIASCVFIGRGVTIGDDVVIGAHSVVTKDVPSNSVVYSEANLRIRHRENKSNSIV